jgi:arylsulfatase A-like enzyme
MDPFGVMGGAITLSGQEIATLQDQYDGCLYYLDQQVGRLVERLKKLGLYEQTIFIVTSDHGESFGEHGLFDHQYGLYEHLLRVPLIVRLPGGARAGERLTQLFQHVDLLPLLKDWLQAKEATSGSSAFIFPDRPARQAAFAEYIVPNLRALQRRFPQQEFPRFNMPLRSIAADGYKLILRRDGQRLLYHLDRDPQETNDLAEAEPLRADQLEQRLFEQLGHWPGGGPPGEEDPEAHSAPLPKELEERLEALGYL